MSRIEPLHPPYDEETGDLLVSLMPPGIPPLKLFRTVAKNPRILRKLRGGNLLDRGSIARRDRELAILRATARCGAEYEWGVHVSAFAETSGLSADVVDATVTGSVRDPRFDKRDAAVVALVDELHENATVSDDTWATVRDFFDEAQVIELITVAGFYHTISFLVRALGVELEEGAAGFPGHAARAESAAGGE